MGTYDDSRIRMARTEKLCRQCGLPIYKGYPYLAYKAGQRSTAHIHMSCARLHANRWRCRELEADMARETP